MLGFALAYAGLLFGWMAGGHGYLPGVMTMVVGMLITLVLGPVLTKREDVDASPSPES